MYIRAVGVFGFGQKADDMGAWTENSTFSGKIVAVKQRMI